jgi:hypothetical protein
MEMFCQGDIFCRDILFVHLIFGSAMSWTPLKLILETVKTNISANTKPYAKWFEPVNQIPR